MSEISRVYTKQEVTNQLVQNVIAKQNNILSGKKEKQTGLFQNQNAQNNQQDSLYISSEAQMLFEQMERMREENEESAKTAEQQSKCMLIAMRIAAGDEVPEKDIKFLMKYNMGLYAKAMQMRIPKQEPEEYDTVLDEEDEQELEKSEMGGSLTIDGPQEMGELNVSISFGDIEL